MLATSHFAPSSSPHQFLPAIPSPLSPRSANIYGRHPARDSFMSSSTEPSGPAKIFDASRINVSNLKCVPYAKRAIKKAPSPNQDELKERRRNNFLRKVRDNREDRRFEARGEDIMRMDFIQRKRAYENELARSAPLLPSGPIEEDEEQQYELPGWSQSGSQMQLSSQQSVEVEADDFERDEEGELMALLEYMPGQEEMPGGQREESLWSDDADYDELFTEVMNQENELPQCSSQTLPEQQQDGEEMDMS